MIRKIGVLLLGGIVGAGLALLCAFIQADRATVNGHVVYFGVPLAVAIAVTATLWLVRLCQTRLAGVGVLAGWLILTEQLGNTDHGGDEVFMDVTYTTVYLLATAIALGVVVMLPPMRKPLVMEEFVGDFNDE